MHDRATPAIPTSASLKPVGIGGWLALLIVWMVVLRPMAGIIVLNQLHAAGRDNPEVAGNSSWLVNPSTFWFIFLVIAGLSIYGGFRLVADRSAATIRTVIIILWVYSPVAAADLLIGRALLEGRITWPNVATTLASNLAIAAVWTAYLLRSRRIRNTYYPHVGS